MIGGYAQVRIHDGEVGIFFQEKHVPRAVVDLVVAYGRNVGCEHVHDLDGGNALVFGVDERAQEHVTRDCVEYRVSLRRRASWPVLNPSQFVFQSFPAANFAHGSWGFAKRVASRNDWKVTPAIDAVAWFGAFAHSGPL